MRHITDEECRGGDKLTLVVMATSTSLLLVAEGCFHVLTSCQVSSSTLATFVLLKHYLTLETLLNV